MAGAGGPLSRSGLRGRETELAELRAVIGSVARTGSGALVLVRGEAGIGKTTLVTEAVAGAAAEGFSVGLGKADELHHLVPLSSLATCMLHGDRPLLSGDALVDLARRHDQRIRLVERLAEVIEERAGGTPVLLALDDVQWADPLSRFALKQLPRRLRTSPVLWLLSERRGTDGPAARIVAAALDELPVHTLSLGPLSGAAIGRLAGDVLGGCVDARVRGLLEGAGGNPFLAVEMLAGLRSAEGSGEPVPKGLVVGVRGRLNSLHPDTLRFLQRGAVLGRGFAFQDAAALCGRPPVELIPALEEAVRAGLLDDDGDQLVFRHDLLRQAVYVDVPPSARKALHREAAARLVAGGHRPIDVVSHVLRGARPGDEEAVALLRRAADDVLPVTPGLAADLVTRALELVPAARPSWFAAGEHAIVCLTRAGRGREALSTGDRLLACRPPVEVSGRLHAALGGALWNLVLADELRRRTEAALAVGGAAPEVGARLAALRALAMSRAHDLGPARAAGEEALRAAVAIGDREARVQALFALGETALNAGENTLARERFSALCAVDPAYVPEEIVAHQHVDDFETGERLLSKAAEAGGMREAMLLWAQGRQHLELGRLDDAEADFVTMERLEDAVQAHVQQVNGRVIRSRIALLRGDREAAREHLAEARGRLAAKPNPGNTAAVRFLEAVHAEADGDVRLAVDRIRRVQEEGPFLRWRLLRTWVGSAVRMALRGADRELAEDLAAQAEAHAERNPSVPTATGLAVRARGLVLDDPALLERSVALLRRSPRPLVRAAARADLGRALLAAGRRPEAVAALTRARAAFAASGAHAVAARLQRELRGAGAGSQRAASGRPVQGWEALTASEKKVARLVAEGHSNRTAAEVLVVSPHTVNTHLTSAFRKLSVNSRVQLANLVRALPGD
ncbi:helix-turn-helix transcriptional regulator [Streptomyces capoamus]|uniref:Helix-turn-helix transcriptional regulator n=1 Tax=Streptomyces capoamus TaxID=68183 RepID=A0A919C0U9_9ACTN|nr:LuxR family transcriptional regulator [Streptomyces capoamus]GGW14100.1 helix-turn-helix transcriptional regulator [Streptomyces libani subsp. rufus]GHG39982.1 helix-turn-helix transcriptional regulator [Streptomyces capoamus]